MSSSLALAQHHDGFVSPNLVTPSFAAELAVEAPCGGGAEGKNCPGQCMA